MGSELPMYSYDMETECGNVAEPAVSAAPLSSQAAALASRAVQLRVGSIMDLLRTLRAVISHGVRQT